MTFSPSTAKGPRNDTGTNLTRRGQAQTRILDAVSDVAARDGFAHLTVEKILAAAGVSRASFYQYFSNVEDCFRDAYRHHARRLLDDLVPAARRSRDPELAVLSTLIDTAIAHPQAAKLIMAQSLAAGAIGFAERDALIADIERAMMQAPLRSSVIDLPIGALIGSAFRFISMRLLDGRVSDELREQLLQWARTFARPYPHTDGWSGRLVPARRDHARPPDATCPAGSPRDGPPRDRIVRATARTIQAKGYHSTTVADIVALARVSRRLFYNHFQNKSDAVASVFEHGLQQILAACTPAFFSAGSWPQRVWDSAGAFTGVLAREPAIAHLGLVECHALGPQFAARVHQTQLAFTIFLEEGYRQRPDLRQPPRVSSPLTAMTIMEVFCQAARRDPGLQLRASQPLAVYIALTPFTGAEAAGAFVVGKLAAKPTR